MTILKILLSYLCNLMSCVIFCLLLTSPEDSSYILPVLHCLGKTPWGILGIHFY